MRVAEDYPLENEFEYNKSYKIIDGELTKVKHGTPGSQRPDFYNPSTNTMIEVKNYTVTTPSGRKSLANNIEMQYNSRKEMFPGVDIKFQVDIVGQAYTQEMLNEILKLVEQQTGINGLVQFILD